MLFRLLWFPKVRKNQDTLGQPPSFDDALTEAVKERREKSRATKIPVTDKAVPAPPLDKKGRGLYVE